MLHISKRNWLRALCVMLASLLASMIILNIARSEELETANLRINAVYQKAFYETCELTEGISANFRKLLVAGDNAQALLGEISRQTQGASGNLALLPLGQETVSATIKFINQAEDFAETLSDRLSIGGKITDQDYQTMRTLSETAAEFSVALSGLLNRYEDGEAIFSGNDFAASGSESLAPLTNGASEYPVLLYDGPFSDGAAGGTYEWLRAMRGVTADQAEEKLRAFIDVDGIRYLGESQPEVDCYEFSIQTGDYALSAGVTKQGGEILYLLPENTPEAVNLTPEECCDIARAFLVARGYGLMEMSYYSRFGGVLTVNFAATQDGVILYPDLVKVQLSMKDGQVIGFDAKNYLKNHSQRSISMPAITEEQAQSFLNPRLNADGARLCVIPQNNSEFLCYEIAAHDGSGQFLVYIDAETGAERNLMQILSRDSGTLVV